jgi:hypothetical protein
MGQQHVRLRAVAVSVPKHPAPLSIYGDDLALRTELTSIHSYINLLF